MKNKIPTTYFAMVTSYTPDGKRHDSVFYRKSERKNDIWYAAYFDGELFGKPSKVYKVNTEAPYIRDCGYYFKVTDEYLLALKDVLNR